MRIRRTHARLAANLLEARVTIEQADGSLRRDRIVQRPYEATELETALTRNGFAVADVERFDPFGGAGEPTKALWVAQRRRT